MVYTLFLIFAYSAAVYAQQSSKVDPLSRITISSSSARCAKDTHQKDHFIFTYQGDVKVTFADQSTATADSLSVIIDNKQSTKGTKSCDTKKNQTLEVFKKITFTTNVCIVSGQRKAHADTAHFYIPHQRCVLEGNVKIWQTKQKENDVPLAVESQKAELFLKTGEFNLIGSAQKPVHTTIVLEDHPAFKKKKDSKPSKKKNEKNSRSANA